MIVFSGLGLLHLGYVFFVSVPLIHADEAGHLLKAAALAGYSTHGPTPYGIGIPILSAPLFLIFDQPETIFRLVLIMNAALATLTAWLVYRFLVGWRHEGQRWPAALLAALAASFYPASFAYTTSAQAEVLFASVMAGLMLANFRLATSNGQGWGALLISAALTGVIALVHLRGAPTAVLSAAFAVFMLLRARRPGALFVWFAIAASIASAGWWLANEIEDRLTLASLSETAGYSSDSYHLLSKLQMFLSPEAFLSALGRLVMSGAGQLSYLVAATLGLLVVGVWAMASRARIEPHVPVQAFCIFGLVLLAANLGMSAFSLAEATRVDHVIYGRYNEAVLPVFLAIGLLEINWSGARTALISFAASMTVLVLILTAISDGQLTQTNLHNIMSLNWSMEPFSGLGFVFLVKAGCAAAIILLSARHTIGGTVLVAAFFAMQSYFLAVSFLNPSSFGRDSQRRIAEYMKTNVEPGTCVTQHLTSDMSPWSHWNTKFFLFKYQLMEERDIQPDRLCSEWVISADPDFQDEHPGAVLVHRERLHSQRLWYLGESSEALNFPNELTGGARISFGNARGADFLVSGWGEIERWGVWMVGPQSLLEFRIPENSDGECSLRLRGEWFLKGQRTEGRVSVRLGEGPIRTFEGRLPDNLFNWLLAIDPHEVNERRLVLEINAENPQSMQELGLGDDTRRLSIGLTDLVFEGCRN
ncbi:hypothetical protein [Roseibium sp. M-1]